MWRPMSVLTMPGHTLLTTTRGLDQEVSNRQSSPDMCLPRIVMGVNR